ncbi:MAG: ABC transporter permease, partial [Acetobacteraceae bacterium]|nr:ABC transporter permease [Acetobacteraceae bacterium]
MAGYVVRKVAFFFASVFVASVLIFVLIRAAGGNVAALVLGQDASPAAIDALARQYGLDRPWAAQYVQWVGAMLQGDLGRSFRTGQGVTALITAGLSVSVPLALSGLALGTLLAIP